MTDKKEKMSAETENKKEQSAVEENSENVQNSEGIDNELNKLKEENQKLKDSFLRAYAEAENTKKRCQQEI